MHRKDPVEPQLLKIASYSHKILGLCFIEMKVCHFST